MFLMCFPIQVCEPRWLYEHDSLNVLIKTQGGATCQLSTSALCILIFEKIFFIACTLNDTKVFYVTFKEVFFTWQGYILTI